MRLNRHYEIRSRRRRRPPGPLPPAAPESDAARPAYRHPALVRRGLVSESPPGPRLSGSRLPVTGKARRPRTGRGSRPARCAGAWVRARRRWDGPGDNPEISSRTAAAARVRVCVLVRRQPPVPTEPALQPPAAGRRPPAALRAQWPDSPISGGAGPDEPGVLPSAAEFLGAGASGGVGRVGPLALAGPC